MSANAIPVTLEEKAAAFDALANGLTNQWESGQWSWWCPVACGGPSRATRSEAVADLVAWAYRQKPKKRRSRRVSLPVVS